MTDRTIFDDIRRDAEAGTPGPWVISDATPGRIIGAGAAVADTNIRFTGLLDGEVGVNARRIARVPELERIALAAERLAKAGDAVAGTEQCTSKQWAEWEAAFDDFRAAVEAKP